MTQPAPKALFASYSGLFGGAERLLLDCATGLESAAVACPEGPLAQAAREAGLTVTVLSTQPLEFRRGAGDRIAAPRRIASQARELRRAARELRPPVVFAWNMRGLLVGAMALRLLRPRPALVFVHNDFLPAGPAVARTVRAAARRATRVVCPSEAVAEDLDPDGRLADRIRIIYPGVDLARFTPGPAPGGAHGAQVLSLGAVVGWKRPDLALEVAARAARLVPGFCLHVAGEPLDESGARLFAALHRRAELPDLRWHVRLEGPLSDPLPVLRGADCLLHCADREPFGLALVEALACGVPVVAPDAGGPREIVDSACGVRYPPGDASAAAAALVGVLNDPVRRAELSAGARARAERLFDRERLRADYRRLTAELTG
jgi:glycosyltransferase involved in cell wall biosynthesis